MIDMTLWSSWMRNTIRYDTIQYNIFLRSRKPYFVLGVL